MDSKTIFLDRNTKQALARLFVRGRDVETRGERL